jgi:ribosomal protein S12 methylthiotransferase accessory factor
VGQEWRPLLFEASSNGLASGNTYDEAVLHGLYEVVERDAAPRPGVRALDLRTVDGTAGDVVDRLRSADAMVWVDVLASPFGLPCFRAWIVSDTFPVPTSGAGCHLDRDVALCRALTEAAQVRVTTINGAREDIPESLYRRAERHRTRPTPRRPAGAAVSFQDLESVCQSDLGEDLRLVTSRVQALMGRQPLVVDHTRPDMNIPVVHVVCPGLTFDP